MTNHLGFNAATRAKIRVAQLIVILIMLIHFTTCYFYTLVGSNYLDFGTGSFAFNFWMPPVDLNDNYTSYYEDSKKMQYLQSFYYAFLLITANDIAPQTPE